MASRSTLLGGLLEAGAASAAATVSSDSKPGPKSQAKISCDQAQEVALVRSSDGRVVSAELEEGHGQLVNSFDIRTAKGAGIEEVDISEATREVLSLERATPADQARERKEDAKAR